MKEHICKRCGKWHPLFYRLDSNGAEHLLYTCTRINQTFCISYVRDLPIPHLKAQKILNRETREMKASQQPTLL